MQRSLASPPSILRALRGFRSSIAPLCLGLFVLHATSTPARAGAPATGIAAVRTGVVAQDEFLAAFQAALKKKDEAAMQELVSSRPTEAQQAIASTCERIVEGTSEELEILIDALGTAWRGAFDSRFASKMYEYASLLRPEVKAARAVLMERYVGEVARWEEIMASGSYRDLKGLGFELESYAKGFLELGDLYNASEAYRRHAWSLEEEFLGEEAELEVASEGFREMLRLRDELDLKDEHYKKAAARLDVLENAGVGSGEFTGSLAGKAKREAASAAAVTVGLEFELVKNIEGDRPYYCTDIIFQMWPTLGLNAEGSSTTFTTMPDDSPKLVRTGASAAIVDVDGDGEGEADIPLTGSITPVQVTLGSGDDARPWAFLTCIGQARDRFQGFDFNLEPSQDYLTIYYAPAASLVGEVLGQPIQVFDDNMDGKYGSEPLPWAHIGTVQGGYGQTDMDSMTIGKEKSARPWSPLTKIGEEWFQLEVEGMQLTATPAVDVATGTLKLDFKGGKPDYVIVQGNTKWGTCFFDLAGAKKGVEVPVGSYYLITGKLTKGKREQTMKALMVPGKDQKGYDVAAEESLTIQLGAPFGFTFEVEDSQDSVRVKGATVAVQGRGGETYERLYNCVVTPEASVRKVGTKKASATETMRTATHQDDLAGPMGFDGAWFPWDLELPKKKSGDEVEVQLTIKKHKLFGKIASEWRQ